MPLTREQKERLVGEYGEQLEGAGHVFLVDYKGISVPEVTELRSRVRGGGGSYVVMKNRLALRAIGGKGLEALEKHFQGPTAAAWGGDDPIALAKVLTEFAKEVPALELKAGIVEGREIGAEDIRELASLPRREELLAKLLFLMQSPVTRFVRTLAEMPRRFVATLHQIAAGKAAQD
jgi:large subunit ribosomal protein L10